MVLIRSSCLDFSFCLLRHAEAVQEGRDVDKPLTEKGIEQALLAKERLKEFQWDLVISSRAKRAQQTARLIAPKAPLFLSSILYELLGETISLYSLLHHQHPLLHKAIDEIEKAAKKAQAKEVLVVAHSGVINMLAAAFCQEEASYLFHAKIANADGILLTRR